MLRNDSKSVQLGNCLSEIYSVYKISKNLPISNDPSNLAELKLNVVGLIDKLGSLFVLLNSWNNRPTINGALSDSFKASNDNSVENNFLKTYNDVINVFLAAIICLKL
jgi:hypothetical protein